MPEELTFLNTLVTQLGGNGLTLGLVMLFLWKKGVLKNFMNGNGNGHNHEEINSLKSELSSLKDNHIHDLGNKLDKLLEHEIEGNLISKEILIILKQKRE